MEGVLGLGMHCNAGLLTFQLRYAQCLLMAAQQRLLPVKPSLQAKEIVARLGTAPTH